MIGKITNILLISFLFTAVSYAQLEPVPLEIDNAVQRVHFDVDTQEEDIYETNFIHSTLDGPMSITWEKIIDYSGSRAWGFQVCDKNLCYLEHVDSRPFEMEAEETGEMTVHLRRNGTMADSAVVYVRLYRSDIDNSDSMYLKVSFIAGMPTSTTMAQVDRSDVEIFPNPATSYFTVKSPANIGDVIVYDIVGRKLLQENLNGAHRGRIAIEHLREGTYFVATHDINGNKLKTMRVIKRLAGS